MTPDFNYNFPRATPLFSFGMRATTLVIGAWLVLWMASLSGCELETPSSNTQADGGADEPGDPKRSMRGSMTAAAGKSTPAGNSEPAAGSGGSGETKQPMRPEKTDNPGSTAGPPAQMDAGSPMTSPAPKYLLKQPSKGAAIVLTQDETIAVVVNRDVGSVSVLSISGSYQDKYGTVQPKLVRELDLGRGSEPWQVVIGADDDTAYVVLRRDQKLVKIGYLKSSPEVLASADVGSEPTSVALTPSGRVAYVPNWNDGDISVIETESMHAKQPIDLNQALVDTGYLGDVKARAALAHPRSITVTNDGDDQDDDESLLVTEYYAQQIAELQADGKNADVNKQGIVYQVSLHDRSTRTIGLAALNDIGFKDTNGEAAGCYPNQLQSITLLGNYAYVVSVCAAPEGPEGLKLTTKECQTVDDCRGEDLKLVDPVCDVVAQGKPAVCQDVANFKTATSPVVSVIDVKSGHEVAYGAQNLAARFDAFFKANKVATRRFPVFATDLLFVPGTSVGYVVGNAIDAVFRVVYDGETGMLKDVGSSTSPFINLFPLGKGPVGIAIGSADRKFALVASNTTRNVLAVDFNSQAIALDNEKPINVATAAAPAKDSDEEKIVIGKDLFNTGRARWSLAGEGWGSCQSCHSDGLTDNVTWFFGRGPRQSVSLDSSFASKNALDQRIFNHTSNRDEVADFSINTRTTSGGVGAIVLATSTPPQNLDRIDVDLLKLSELNGSMLAASDPANPLGLAFDANGKVAVGELMRNPAAMPAGGVLPDWLDITRYIQTIRTPRAPKNLDHDKVKAGEELFSKYGSCAGCHGGEKWTVSRLFYQPSVATNQALKVTDFAVPQGFPTALLPAEDALDRKLVLNAGGESVQCVLRNVKTFRNAEPGVGIAELRNDMITLAQGGGNVARPNADGDNNADNDPKANIGYNVPSLLGVSTGAPYMHAGNARTLEALLASQFSAHHQALAPNFLLESNQDTVQEQIDALVQYLLSIDEQTYPLDLPKPGAGGGALCPDKFSAPAY